MSKKTQSKKYSRAVTNALEKWLETIDDPKQNCRSKYICKVLLHIFDHSVTHTISRVSHGTAS